jgi:hypothetical protein
MILSETHELYQLVTWVGAKIRGKAWQVSAAARLELEHLFPGMVIECVTPALIQEHFAGDPLD